MLAPHILEPATALAGAASGASVSYIPKRRPWQSALASPTVVERNLMRSGVIALFALAVLAAPLPAMAGAEDLSLNARFLMAARNGDAPALQRTLTEGAAINSRNRLGETALLSALKKADLTMARILIAAGADVNQAAINGLTPLMAAAYAGQAEVVQELIDRGAKPDATDRIGKNAMIYAAGEGHTPVVRILLKCGVDPNAVYVNELTALMWAAGYGRTEAVKALLEAGARADFKDNRGKTALQIAQEMRHDATISALAAVR